MRLRLLALAAFAFLVAAPAVVTAQAPPPPPDWSIELAGKAWVSSGWSNWNFKAGGVDPATDLRWRGVDVVLGEFSADIVWKRIVWSLAFGGNPGMDGGALIDESFAQSDRNARFSTIRSPVEEGHVVYVNNDIGFRALEWRQPLLGEVPPEARGWVDVFIGYQYWQEEYTAFGVHGSLILPSGTIINQAEPVSVKYATNKYTRHSLRLGARAQVPLAGGLGLRASAIISPYTHTDYEDTHFLSTDLRQPSVSTANGGFGTQLEAGFTYAVWGGLTAEAGFRYWYFDSGSGDVVTKGINGTVSRDKLNEAITERYGPYVGLRWRF